MRRLIKNCFVADNLKEGIIDTGDILYYFNQDWGNIKHLRTIKTMLSYISMKYQECTNEQAKSYLRKFYAYFNACVNTDITYVPAKDGTFLNYVQKLSHLFEKVQEEEPHKKPLSKLRVKDIEITTEKLSELSDFTVLFIYNSEVADPYAAFTKDMFASVNSLNLSPNKNLCHEDATGRCWLSENNIHVDFVFALNILINTTNYLCNCGSFARETMYPTDILEINNYMNQALAIVGLIQHKHASPYKS